MPPPYEKRDSPPQVGECTDIVTIEISGGRKFTVHAHLLAHYSEYFRRALNSGMEEASSLHFRLTEHTDFISMSRFVSWIYAAEWSKLGFWFVDDKRVVLDTWLLADYFQALEFQDFLVRLLQALYPDNAKEEENHLIRNFHFDALKRGNIRRSSGMYRFIVSRFAKLISHHQVSEDERHSYLEMLDSDTNTAITGYLMEQCSRAGFRWIDGESDFDEVA